MPNHKRHSARVKKAQQSTGAVLNEQMITQNTSSEPFKHLFYRALFVYNLAPSPELREFFLNHYVRLLLKIYVGNAPASSEYKDAVEEFITNSILHSENDVEFVESYISLNMNFYYSFGYTNEAASEKLVTYIREDFILEQNRWLPLGPTHEKFFE